MVMGQFYRSSSKVYVFARNISTNKSFKKLIDDHITSSRKLIDNFENKINKSKSDKSSEIDFITDSINKTKSLIPENISAMNIITDNVNKTKNLIADKFNSSVDKTIDLTSIPDKVKPLDVDSNLDKTKDSILDKVKSINVDSNADSILDKVKSINVDSNADSIQDKTKDSIPDEYTLAKSKELATKNIITDIDDLINDILTLFNSKRTESKSREELIKQAKFYDESYIMLQERSFKNLATIFISGVAMTPLYFIEPITASCVTAICGSSYYLGKKIIDKNNLTGNNNTNIALGVMSSSFLMIPFLSNPILLPIVVGANVVLNAAMAFALSSPMDSKGALSPNQESKLSIMPTFCGVVSAGSVGLINVCAIVIQSFIACSTDQMEGGYLFAIIPTYEFMGFIALHSVYNIFLMRRIQKVASK
jgi:hypothetical protein